MGHIGVKRLKIRQVVCGYERSGLYVVFLLESSARTLLSNLGLR